MVSRKRAVMCEMFITSGQEWAVSRKYLTFRWSLHIANSLSNTSVKVVCFSVLHQQAGRYHVTAFRCCIGVEPLQMISESAHAGLHPQTHVQPRLQGLLAFQYGGGRREDPGTQQKSRDWFVHGEWKFIQNGGKDKDWEDLGTRSWDWRKTNKMAAKANAREAKNMKECT